MTTLGAMQDLLNLNNRTNQTQFQQGQQNLGKSNVGKDGFMQLMMAQLRNQNPMEPVDNSQMLAQQAQFSQLEQLQTLNDNLSKASGLSSASTLVGKKVEYKDSAGQSHTGLVDSVLISGNSIGLQIGNATVTTEQITKILAR